MATRKNRSKMRKVGRKLRKTKSSRKRMSKRVSKRMSKRGGGDIDLNLTNYGATRLPFFSGLGSLGTRGQFLDAPLQNTART